MHEFHSLHVHLRPCMNCKDRSLSLHTAHMYTDLHSTHVYRSTQHTCIQIYTAHMYTDLHSTQVYRSTQHTCTQIHTARPLPEMLAFFFAFLKDLALEFAFSHFSGICTKNRIFRQLSQLPILFLCGSTCFGWHSYL